MSKEIRPYNMGGGGFHHGVLVIDEWMPLDEMARLTKCGDACQEAGLLAPFGPGKWTMGLKRFCQIAGVDPISLGKFVWQEASRAYWGIEELDYAVYSRMEAGGAHKLHSDAFELDGTPNHTHWRTLAVGIYLSTAGIHHSGGQLTFPNLELTVATTMGMLVAFPADLIWQHSVSVVTSGVRECLLFWYK